ncbi:uncharacterized protein [Ptychodera flava]|uniref:uncharacterized protein isoform X2 n=1 Tax=Ptychodera flava TaxID=63121 RepID=UPI00396A53B2
MGEQCSFSLRSDLTPGLVGSPTRQMCVCLPLENCFDEDLNGWDINNWVGCSSAGKRSARKSQRNTYGSASKQETATPPQLPAFIKEMNQTEKPYKFTHFIDTRQYITEYRKHYVIQDESLKNTSFGFDSDENNAVPDPYEFKIWKYRELFNRLDSILQTNSGREKLDEQNFWTRIVDTLRARALQNQRARDRAKGEDFLAKYRHDQSSLKPRHPGRLKDPNQKSKQRPPITAMEFKELQLPIIQTSYASLALTVATTKPSGGKTLTQNARNMHLEMMEEDSMSDTSSLSDTPPARPRHPPPDARRLYCEGTEVPAMNNAKSCLDLLYGAPAPNVKFPFSVQIVHDVNGVQGSKRSYQPPLRRASSVPLKEMPPIESIASYRFKHGEYKDKKRTRKGSDQSDKYVTAARENFERAREKFFGSRPNTSSNRNQPSVASVREWDLQTKIDEIEGSDRKSHKSAFTSSSFVSDASDAKVSEKKEKAPSKQLKQELAIRDFAMFEETPSKVTDPPTDVKDVATQEKTIPKPKIVDREQTGNGVRWESSLINSKPKLPDGMNASQFKKSEKRSENLPLIEYRSRLKIEGKAELQEKLQASLRLLPLNNDSENKEKPKRAPPAKNANRPGQIKVRIMDISETRENGKGQDNGPTKLGIKGQATGPEKRRSKPRSAYEQPSDSPRNRKVDTSTPRDKLVEVPKFLPTQIKMAELNTVIVEGHPYVTEDQHKAFVNAKTRTG